MYGIIVLVNIGIMQFACQEHRFLLGNVVGIKHKHGAHINQACL